MSPISSTTVVDGLMLGVALAIAMLLATRVYKVHNSATRLFILSVAIGALLHWGFEATGVNAKYSKRHSGL